MLKKAIANLKILKEIVGLHETIFQMINWYCTKDFQDIEKIPNREIVINLDTEETKRTTILINKKIYDDFNILCQDHKEYDKKDLLSMALKEYIENHKID